MADTGECLKIRHSNIFTSGLCMALWASAGAGGTVGSSLEPVARSRAV